MYNRSKLSNAGVTFQLSRQMKCSCTFTVQYTQTANQPVTGREREPAGSVNNPEPSLKTRPPPSVTGCCFQDKSIHLTLTDPIWTTQPEERHVMLGKGAQLRIFVFTTEGSEQWPQGGSKGPENRCHTMEPKQTWPVGEYRISFV